jgi:hypothetical protein
MYQWYIGMVGHSTKLYHNIFFHKAFVAAMGEYHQWLPNIILSDQVAWGVKQVHEKCLVYVE